MKPETTNSFCWMPFFQLAMKVFDNDENTREIAPCCNSIRVDDPNVMGLNGKIAELTPDQIFHLPEFVQLRKDMLEGVRNPICKTCWRIEDEDRISYRLFSSVEGWSSVIQKDEQQQAELIESPQLLAVDTSSSLRCNLRCRMCNAGSSDKLFEHEQTEFKRLGHVEEVESLTKVSWSFGEFNYDFKRNNKQMQWLRTASHIEAIKISGGEPFYDEDFIDFLTDFTNNGAQNTTLFLHTNATQFNKRSMDILNRFKKVVLNFSIDSVGKNYEYIRHPMTWDGLTKSVDRFQRDIQTDHIVLLNSVLQNTNILHMGELIDWSVQRGFHASFSDLNPSRRAGDPRFLPKYILEEALARVQERFDKVDHYIIKIDSLIRDLNHYIEVSEPTDESHRRMRRELQLFDAVKKQSYRDYLDPLLIEYIDQAI